MPKRQPSLSPAQLGFTFDPPQPATAPAALAGLDRKISAAVGIMLREDTRDRRCIACEMSKLLGDEVSHLMLDAYASEARDNHNISAARLFALVAVTKRHDVLDPLVREIGGALLVGEEIITARLGHLDRQIAALKAERSQVERRAKPIDRGGGSGA